MSLFKKMVEAKIADCVRLARQCRQDAWQANELTTKQRKECKRVSREAMQDAREYRRANQALSCTLIAPQPLATLSVEFAPLEELFA